MCKSATEKATSCCWALLPNKSEDAYQLLMNAVLRKVNREGRDDYKPTTIYVDFENTVIKVLKARFPSSKISGCTFHVRQAIWRKLQEMDLIPFFHRDADFQELVYIVYVFSFVPMDKIVDYYEEVILQRIEDKTSLEADEDGDVVVEVLAETAGCFVAYLDHTWIGRKAARSGRRGCSLIAHDLWNQFETLAMSSEEDEAFCLTNNSLERYNRTLKKLVGSHPNVWLFIQSLIGQEVDARRVLMHNATGMDISCQPGPG
jgi:hypothetical protein